MAHDNRHRVYGASHDEGCIVVDAVKQLRWNEVFGLLLQLIPAIGMIAGFILWVSGNLSGNAVATHDISIIKLQMTDVSNQLSQLRDKIDNGPRADQLREMDRHLSALDGRDDIIDQRVRTVEQQQAAQQARLEGIDAASRARLGGR